MPTLLKPKSKRLGQPTRTSSVWHIRYYCPIRCRSVVISTLCKSLKNAERRLRKFCDLLECGEVGLENPFLLQHRQQIADADRLAVTDCLADFEAELRAGRVRRGKRRPVSRAHADLTLARVGAVVDACRVSRASELAVPLANGVLDRMQASAEIKTAQTRKHYERAIKSFSRWLASSGRLGRDPLEHLEVTSVGAGDVVHGRGAFRAEEIEAIAEAAQVGPVRRGLSGLQRYHLYLFAANTGCGRRNVPPSARWILAPPSRISASPASSLRTARRPCSPSHHSFAHRWPSS